MHIRYVEETDRLFWFTLDRHLPEKEFDAKVRDRRGYVLLDRSRPAGLLRFNLFWDNTPFCTMLVVGPEFRGRGGGRQLVGFWEREMGSAGYDMVLTFTLSSEQAQFFYRRLGYQDCGALVLPGEALEILLMKRLRLRYRKADSIIEGEDGLRPHGRIAD